MENIYIIFIDDLNFGCEIIDSILLYINLKDVILQTLKTPERVSKLKLSLTESYRQECFSSHLTFVTILLQSKNSKKTNLLNVIHI